MHVVPSALTHGTQLFVHTWCTIHSVSFHPSCLDLLFPATSVDVECVFSHKHLTLPYICNHLSFESTCAVLCLGFWSTQGLVKDYDIRAALSDGDVEPVALEGNTE